MADYSGGLILTGDWSDIPMSSIQPRDNPLSAFVGAVTDNTLINKIGSDIQPRDNPLPAWEATQLPSGQVIIDYYAMRGRDNEGYKTWVATGSPDINASQYVGPISGTMTDIVVLKIWSS